MKVRYLIARCLSSDRVPHWVADGNDSRFLRFWDAADWKTSRASGVSPVAHDKQYVCDWGKQLPTPFIKPKSDEPLVGINNLDPKNSAHRSWIGLLTVPQEVLDEMTGRYHAIFDRLAEMAVTDCQDKVMSVGG